MAFSGQIIYAPRRGIMQQIMQFGEVGLLTLFYQVSEEENHLKYL